MSSNILAEMKEAECTKVEVTKQNGPLKCPVREQVLDARCTQLFMTVCRWESNVKPEVERKSETEDRICYCNCDSKPRSNFNFVGTGIRNLESRKSETFVETGIWNAESGTTGDRGQSKP